MLKLSSEIRILGGWYVVCFRTSSCSHGRTSTGGDGNTQSPRTTSTNSATTMQATRAAHSVATSRQLSLVALMTLQLRQRLKFADYTLTCCTRLFFINVVFELVLCSAQGHGNICIKHCISRKLVSFALMLEKESKLISNLGLN